MRKYLVSHVDRYAERRRLDQEESEKKVVFVIIVVRRRKIKGWMDGWMIPLGIKHYIYIYIYIYIAAAASFYNQ